MYPNITETVPKLTCILQISQTAHEDKLVVVSTNIAIKLATLGRLFNALKHLLQKHEDMSSIPSTHVKQTKNHEKYFWDPSVLVGMTNIPRI